MSRTLTYKIMEQAKEVIRDRIRTVSRVEDIWGLFHNYSLDINLPRWFAHRLLRDFKEELQAKGIFNKLFDEFKY